MSNDYQWNDQRPHFIAVFDYNDADEAGRRLSVVWKDPERGETPVDTVPVDRPQHTDDPYEFENLDVPTSNDLGFALGQSGWFPAGPWHVTSEDAVVAVRPLNDHKLVRVPASALMPARFPG